MAKSLVINNLGGKNKFIFLPCSDTVAADFAMNNLDGEYKVCAKETEFGTDSGITEANKVAVFGRNTLTGEKQTLYFTAKANKSSVDIETALQGKTFNGVKFDEVSVKITPLLLA